jgi:hypothetical protein
MKRLMFLVIAVALVSVAAGILSAGDNTKTPICHFDNSTDGIGHVIWVTASSYAAHIPGHPLDFVLDTLPVGDTCSVPQ